MTDDRKPTDRVIELTIDIDATLDEVWQALTTGEGIARWFGPYAAVTPGEGGVRMEFGVTNGSQETLTGLRVQMCVMLGRLTGFEQQTNENKLFSAPFAACHDGTGRRWIITGWERCGRAWGNAPCPCLHSDPVIEDCPPGQSATMYSVTHPPFAHPPLSFS